MPLSSILSNVADPRALFGLLHGRLALHFQQADAANVVFNIYRDGKLLARSVRDTNRVDAASGDYLNRVYSYVIEAIDSVTGNASHLSPTRHFQADSQQRVILAKEMQNRGGNLVDGHHFENWGKSEDELLVKSFRANRTGRYVIRAEFSNGAGSIETGITCAVKKLEVRQLGSDTVMAVGYLIMPQSGDWKRWDISTPITANLDSGVDYSIRISEDEYSRNMSYLKNNERYTDYQGGGPTDYNYVNIAALHLLRVQDGSVDSESK